MQPRFEKVSASPGRSFRLEERRLSRFDAPWHFHPEIELTLIVSSRGRRFVGDSIEPFTEGDLVLLGPNLPHFWHNEGRQPRGHRAHSLVVQFERDFLGRDFLQADEATPLRHLFDQAARGVVFSGPIAIQAAERLRRCTRLRGMSGLVQLLTVLDDLTRSRMRPLASRDYAPRLSRRGELRLARVYGYLALHFREPLTLAQIARVAAMTPAAFSRYFKRATGRNVSIVLNQLRVDDAARSLLETDDRISDVALAAGFPSLSNFNRQFRELKHLAPRRFRRAFRHAVSGD